YNEKKDNIIQSGKITAIQTENQFNNYIDESTNIVDFFAFNIDSMLSKGTDNKLILNFMVDQSNALIKTIFPNTTGLYGYINGEYLDGAMWEPGADYVPTERPWYTEAIKNGGKITTLEPYIDPYSGNYMLSIAKMLSDGKSVVVMDIELEKIQQITEAAIKSDAADIEIIFNQNNIALAHSDKEKVGKDFNAEKGTIEYEIVNYFKTSDENFFDFKFENSHYIVYAEEIHHGWVCLSIKDATTLFSPLTTILSFTIVAILITVLIISIIMVSSGKKQIISQKLNTQLSSTSNIYISLHEIDFLNDTFVEIRNSSKEASAIIGNKRDMAQSTIREIMEKFVAPISRDDILDFVDFSKINQRLKSRDTITLEFLTQNKTWRNARYIVSSRLPDGTVARAMYLIEDINEEKQRRDLAFEAIHKLNEQISAVAKIYFFIFDINFKENTFSELRTNFKRVSDFLLNNNDNAQETMYKFMNQMTDEHSKDSICKFIDFSTINERMKDSNTITEEFLSTRNIWCRARFVVSKRDENGDIENILWLVENIDAEKRQRDSLLETTKALNFRVSSISNIYMSVYELDLENDIYTEIKSTNKEVSDIISRSHSTAQNLINKVMINNTESSFVEDMLSFIDFSTLESRLSNVDTITFEYINPKCQWRRARFIASRRNELGKVSHILWLIEDIDNDKKEQYSLIDISERALAASEAKSSFLSNMSHEIRTPINAVLGMNEMILRECDNKTLVEYSESIKTAGNTLLGIINDILDFSKIEAGKMEIIPTEYDISSLINDLVNMVQKRADDKGLVLVLDIDKNIPKMLRGDDVRIKQIITNILTNAVKYTEKGSVTFSIGYEKIPDNPNKVLINIAVKDTGIGIKQEDMNKLFTEFERIEEKRNRKIEGTGLGMSITQSLLKMMGSTLKVESVYGLGSKFFFKLEQDVISWDALGDYEAAYKASIATHKKYHEKFKAPEAKLLIVDDTPMNLMVFQSLLKKTKIKIDTAESGNEGLALAYNKKYDIIFLDHMMPEKDGIETLQELKANGNNPNIDTPTVCLTANAISGAREQYISAGFDDYLTKPIDSSKLEEMILHYLPKDKIEILNTAEEQGNETKLPDFISEIEELDTSIGLNNCGSVDAYLSTLKTYAEMIEENADETEKFWKSRDILNTTVKVHAMKSTSRIVGAKSIGELAQELENAGNENDTEKLEANIENLLERCRNLGKLLSSLRDDDTDDFSDENLPLISDDELKEAYALLKEALEAGQFDNITEIAENLKDYRIPEEAKGCVKEILKAVDNLDYDKLSEILS
ncbi:MAG: response regulator, partial [Clostridiales bacterium]|nr:response regulator [Clostridiales bacterium]